MIHRLLDTLLPAGLLLTLLVAGIGCAAALAVNGHLPMRRMVQLERVTIVAQRERPSHVAQADAMPVASVVGNAAR